VGLASIDLPIRPQGSFDHFSHNGGTGMRHDRSSMIELAKQPCLDGGMT
jgi:hypothetical protein